MPVTVMVLALPAFLSAYVGCAQLNSNWSVPRRFSDKETLAFRLPSYTRSSPVAVMFS